MTPHARIRRVTALCMVVVFLVGACSAGRGWVALLPRRDVDVVVIGDSLSTGFATPGDPWTVDANAMLARQRHIVHFVNVAENGAGYLAPGEHGDTFLDEAAKVVGRGSQIVLLFGSDNDVGRPDLADGVRATLSRVRLAAPHAVIIVVGPPQPPAQQRAPLLDISNVLRAAATEVGASFVDPLTLNWFQGASADDVGADFEHPNTRGEQFLADQMAAVLAAPVRSWERT